MFSLLFLLSLVVSSSSAQSSSCPTTCVRKEWRSLSRSEAQAYVSAVTTYYRRNTQEYQSYADIHNTQSRYGIHGTLQFLPWHRWFLVQYERALNRNSGGVCVPYWDASRDTNSFAVAPVFSPNALGAFTSQCIQLGQPSTTIMDTLNKCVARDPSVVQQMVASNRAPVVSTFTLNSLIAQSSTFEVFGPRLEVGYHAQVHVAIAGQMSTMYSPIDPLFFMHHCQVDRLWALWQSKDFQTRLTQFSTTSRNAQLERLESPLLYYTQVKVKDVMDIKPLCYSYDDISSNPNSPTPPPTPGPNPGPSPSSLPANLIRLPGLPENMALDSSKVGPAMTMALRKSSAVTIRNNLNYVLYNSVQVPSPPQRPQWCLYVPGLPEWKCIDTRRMNPREASLWPAVSRDFVDSHWQALGAKLVPMASSLNRRQLGGKIIKLGEVCMLKIPMPLPEFWIRRNGYNIEFVRQVEQEVADEINKLNSLPGFSAGEPDVEVLSQVIRMSEPGISAIEIMAHGRTLQIPYQGDCRSTAALVLERLSTIEMPPKPSAEQLSAVIGAPMFSPNSASNPFK